ILSSHSAVFGAGEIKALTQCLSQLRTRYPGLPKFPRIGMVMKPDQLAMLAQSYLDMIQPRAGDHVRATDKLLSNFFMVGLIHTLFPNARVIHTVRNPIDTCLSA